MGEYGCPGLPEQGRPRPRPHAVLGSLSTISGAGGLFQVVLKASNCDKWFFSYFMDSEGHRMLALERSVVISWPNAFLFHRSCVTLSRKKPHHLEKPAGCHNSLRICGFKSQTWPERVVWADRKRWGGKLTAPLAMPGKLY